MAQYDPAAARFFALQAIRLTGVGMAVFGALILGKIIDLPQPVGYVLLVLGGLDFFVIPTLLAKKWKSPE